MSARLSRGRRAVLALPYLWLLIFFIAPMALVAKISFSHPAEARPPYEPVFSLSDGFSGAIEKLRSLNLDAYRAFAEDNLYRDSLVTSLVIAATSTLITLCIAYPFALAMTRAPARLRPILVALAVAPFWTSFLIRVYAWIALLKDEGLINHVLTTLGLIQEPLGIYATNVAVMIGIVYSYLPFMLLPLYSTLERLDPSLGEAAADLGATPATVFLRVTLPLSRRGVIAGCLLVFIPAVGEFVIPDLLGGSDTLMIGRTIWNDFFANRDWPTASAAAMLLLLLLLGPLLLTERLRLRDERENS
ncbi:ABC transporter permease [Methylocystis bryophila]|uniref:Putrescine ABC transporter permease PotH n=1 Tax=Methylocystis bryophila TaxID=655015 RepID=A0A1W6MQW7_9HYPH|nr:ABC transporter permease subunit [Methylocystis bryophila]ARN79991.1 putrescine ABC transporter permease PotH [Methylocystis bryophila]BDV39899.1 putrescine/spermidine ABC transporter permease [Methylocystis bryophila]